LKAVVLNSRVQCGHRAAPPKNLAAFMPSARFPKEFFAARSSGRIGDPRICGKLPIGYANSHALAETRH
jgi:hypothetical protein